MNMQTPPDKPTQNFSNKSYIEIVAIAVQQNSWFAGLCVAGLYGIGWFIQYSISFRLGVGPVVPSREAAFATGVTLLLYILTLLTFNRENKLWYKDKTTATNVFIILGYIVQYVAYFYVLLLSTIHRSLPDFYLFLILAAAAIVGVNLSIWTIAHRIIENKDKSPIDFVVAMAQIITYTIVIAPVVQPLFGGYALTRAEITTVSKGISGQWLIVTTDTQTTVLARSRSAKQFWIDRKDDKLTLIRIPTSDIKIIKAIPEGRSNFQSASQTATQNTAASTRTHKGDKIKLP